MTDDFLSYQINGLARGINKSLGRKNSSSVSISELSQSTSDTLKKELLILLNDHQLTLADEYIQKVLLSTKIPIEKKRDLIDTYSAKLIQLPEYVLNENKLDVFLLSQRKAALLSQLHNEKYS